MVKAKARDEIRPFSILTRAYEEEINGIHGFELGAFKNKESIPKGMVALNNGRISYGLSNNSGKVEEVLERYKDVPGFCAMQLSSYEEIFEHINNIYELMYHHYIVGKSNHQRFPSFECYPSAHNLMLAGMMAGYPNASVLDSYRNGHCYGAFPFLLGKEKGFIIADPTSDQLWNKDYRPRNHIFVVKHKEWEYKTDWSWSSDLYPDTYVNLDFLKRNKGNINCYDWEIEEYFEKVFENPIRVDLEKEVLDCS